MIYYFLLDATHKDFDKAIAACLDAHDTVVPENELGLRYNVDGKKVLVKVEGASQEWRDKYRAQATGKVLLNYWAGNSSELFNVMQDAEWNFE